MNPNRSVLSDIRFRAACVLLVVLLMMGWVLRTAYRPEPPPRDTRPKLGRLMLLGPGVVSPFGKQMTNLLPKGQVEDSSAVLMFDEIKPSQMFLEAGQNRYPMTQFFVGPGQVLAFVPGGNAQPFTGAQCVLDTPVLGNKHENWEYNLPTLSPSTKNDLHPASSPLASARIVYLSVKGGVPLEALNVSLPREGAGTDAAVVTRATYLRLPTALEPWTSGMSGRELYFRVPFLDDQQAVRVAVMSPYQSLKTVAETQNAKIVLERGWPVLSLTRDLEIRFPNGVRVLLPKQNLLQGKAPKLFDAPVLVNRRFEFPPDRPGFTLAHDSLMNIQTIFRVAGLSLDGKPVSSLGPETPATQHVALRLSAEIFASPEKPHYVDIPISRSPNRITVPLMLSPMQREGWPMALP